MEILILLQEFVRSKLSVKERDCYIKGLKHDYFWIENDTCEKLSVKFQIVLIAEDTLFPMLPGWNGEEIIEGMIQ